MSHEVKTHIIIYCKQSEKQHHFEMFKVSQIHYGKNVLLCKNLPRKVLLLITAKIWTKNYCNTTRNI